jgi:hypothetical protein
MIEKRYTKQQIIDALKKAKSMYLNFAENMACERDIDGENVFDEKSNEKMERFAVAVGDVAFEIECGNIPLD